MRYEDIKVGMKVRALRKSEIPESWGKMIYTLPGGFGVFKYKKHFL